MLERLGFLMLNLMEVKLLIIFINVEVIKKGLIFLGFFLK